MRSLGTNEKVGLAFAVSRNAALVFVWRAVVALAIGTLGALGIEAAQPSSALTFAFSDGALRLVGAKLFTLLALTLVFSCRHRNTEESGQLHEQARSDRRGRDGASGFSAAELRPQADTAANGQPSGA